MHPRDTVEQSLRFSSPSRTTREVAALVGVPRRTVADWLRGTSRSDLDRAGRCPRCGDVPLAASYPYLLGAYLGDGCITTGRRGVYALTITCDDAWPGVAAEVGVAMRDALGSSVCRVRRQGCSELRAYSKHWACLFPQHGPGMKHTRRIALEPWQEQVVDAHTEPFLRGLFHSDGCRMTNWTRRVVAGELKRYEYPRYFFSNKSTDILDLCAAALDRLGIAHRRPRWDTISVARRDAVAALDVFIGPKT